jgi:galactose mutarotase-like enzyme
VLNISYELQGKSILVSWEVINEDKQKMWFSIGGHPAFNVPVIECDKKEDYYLLFEPEEVPEIYRIERGLRTGEKEPISLTDNKLPLSAGLFDHDALIFKNPVSTAISICRGSIKFLTLHHEGFSWLGIWSKNDACPFVCIEPWMGVADHWDHHKNIEKKESILSLEKGAHFKKGYRIEIV